MKPSSQYKQVEDKHLLPEFRPMVQYDVWILIKWRFTGEITEDFSEENSARNSGIQADFRCIYNKVK
ncbi:hypothetical protein [Clostridium perfringens]|uniref:hypothetical protein n=1 Tax=Clostridium perfringens TaxID=1502 RepID=UPI0015E37AFA|nr:hypothetical protein [Clostridium perfringens]